ncbi:hypothetical protein [Citrobacter sp. wls829]|uniref:hypothetical protein n=1 Tax=Citrobacter sp. wls829 TaxID=2576412 RepID=UPI0014854308|nr:hypothetical protein [Citrobacter sp. wls829]
MSRHEINLIDEKSGAKNSICGQEIKKGSTVKNSAPGSFRSIPATFSAPCSSMTTFPVVLRSVHPERLHPAHITPM